MFAKRVLRSALITAVAAKSSNNHNGLALRRTLITGHKSSSYLHNYNNGYPSWSCSLSQRRSAAKATGSEVRAGNVIQRKGRVYQVIKAQHTQQGRGGATIQVELRDCDSGNKVTERLRTDEVIERVYVEEKSLKYLYSEGDMVVLTDPQTFEQIELPKEMFGKSAVYLQDDMTVTVQYYDDRPMSASVPQRVTCTVVEAQTPMKGLSVNAQYKKVVLDNGLTVLAHALLREGVDRVVVYMGLRSLLNPW